MDSDTPRADSWSPGLLWPSVQVAMGVGAVMAGLVGGAPAGLLLSGLLALLLIPARVLQLLRRPRIEVVDGELALKGLTGVRFLPRSEIVEVRDLAVARWGVRSHLMRIEYRDENGDEQLDVFTRGDLGTDPRDVVARLHELGFPGRR